MRKIVLALLLFGCADELPESNQTSECEIYSELYSHTVLFCGGRQLDNIRDVFQVCNYQDRDDNQVEGCVSNFDLVEFDNDCEVQHICWEER